MNNIKIVSKGREKFVSIDFWVHFYLPGRIGLNPLHKHLKKTCIPRMNLITYISRTKV